MHFPVCYFFIPNLTFLSTDAPEFNEKNYSKEVTPGQNVTFTCKAEGNPVPRVSWNYTSAPNVIKATGGSQESIVVTGATSTNAGVYICVATNKVGSVSRSFTLIMKGYYYWLSQKHFWTCIQ